MCVCTYRRRINKRKEENFEKKMNKKRKSLLEKVFFFSIDTTNLISVHLWTSFSCYFNFLQDIFYTCCKVDLKDLLFICRKNRFARFCAKNLLIFLVISLITIKEQQFLASFPNYLHFFRILIIFFCLNFFKCSNKLQKT